jgi:hypothetical protein
MDSRWTDADETALAHAWNWFSLHAGQRLQMFNFFSLTTAFLVAAFVNAHGDGAHRIAAGVAIAGALASTAFNLVEQRTRSLMKASEEPLSVLEARLAIATSVDSIRIVAGVERPEHRLTKYSFVFDTLERAAAIAWTVAGVIELVRY